jgi:hypothetical protein
VVEQAARRGDDDLDAFPQRLGLRLDVHAAVDDEVAQRDVLAVGLHALVHLHGEFARRREDQRAHRMARRRGAGAGVAGQALQQRQDEAGGLAGAGLGAAHDVLAGEHDGNGLGLDGGGLGVAGIGHRLEQFGQQPEFFEFSKPLIALPALSSTPPVEFFRRSKFPATLSLAFRALAISWPSSPGVMPPLALPTFLSEMSAAEC